MKKKMMSVMVLGAFAVFAMQMVVQAQEEVKGPKIMLADEEVVLMDNGKEIGREYVSKNGKEKKALIEKVQDKVLKKMDLNSMNEVEDKKVTEKYNEEVRKYIDIKKLDRPRFLFFVDENGNKTGEISLATKKGKGRLKDFLDPVTNKNTKEFESEIKTYSNSLVSSNEKYAVVFKEVNESPIHTKEYLDWEKQFEATDGVVQFSGIIQLYNSIGKMLYQKEFTSIFGNGIVLSDNGILAIAIDIKNDEDNEKQTLLVFDNTGKSILKYPVQNEAISSIEVKEISPNGKYLAAKVGFPSPKNMRTVFFNILSGNSWTSGKSYVVCEITNDGIADVVFKHVSEKIELKKYLVD